jgi:hypothetical protein
MLSMRLRWLSFMVSVTLLRGVAGFWPWLHRLQGKPHHGWGALLPCCCSGGKQTPCAALSGGRVAEASFPDRCHEKLFSGVLDHARHGLECTVPGAHVILNTDVTQDPQGVMLICIGEPLGIRRPGSPSQVAG